MSHSKIPKIIHQIWLQTEKYIPEQFKEYSSNTKAMNTDFEYKLWDEGAILDLIQDNEMYMNKYYSFPYMHQKIDFARYIILYTYGGIFIDMDAYTIRKLSLLYKLVGSYDVVLSFVRSNAFESFIVCRKSKCLNNGNILCKPQADFMGFLIQRVIINKASSFLTPKISCITKTTGPFFINKAFDEYQGGSKIKVLEAEFIEPCRFDECDVTENSYIIHRHSQTWVNEPIKKVLNFYLRYKTFMPWSILTLILATSLYLS